MKASFALCGGSWRAGALALGGLLVLGPGCASADFKADPRQPTSRSSSDEGSRPQPLAPEDGGPSKLRHDPEEVPLAVRALEKQIDLPAMIMADRIVIDVSPNYEWDISLSGDDVQPQRRQTDGSIVSEAKGKARAVFRNLDLRAYESIVFRRGPMGGAPYIRVTADGFATHLQEVSGREEPRVRRAGGIAIVGPRIEFREDAARPAAQSGD